MPTRIRFAPKFTHPYRIHRTCSLMRINMNFSVSLLLIIGCYRFWTAIAVRNARLRALNDSSHTLQLYRELGNQGAPTETDTAYSSADARRKVCKDITHSGFFSVLDLVPLTTRRLYRKRNSPVYSNYFERIYSAVADSRHHQDIYVYTNVFTPREFNVNLHGFHRFTEYVIVCLLRKRETNQIYPYYVSKEYNVNANTCLPYKPGRFVVGHYFPGLMFPVNYLILAEEAATVSTEVDIHIELYYLGLRKYDIEPASSNAVDPLCKLVSDEESYSGNRHYRFCVAVSRSSHFKDKLEYPRSELVPRSCKMRRVSFRSVTGVTESVRKSYNERMILCASKRIDADEEMNNVSLFISRAYLSNQVFVYLRNPLDGRIYLENLSSNVSIVDELNSFDFVED